MTGDDANSPGLAFVGSFTTASRQARGEGIRAYRTGSGKWTQIGCQPAFQNPSYLVASQDRRFLYCVHGDGRHATAFAIDRASGSLTRISHVATHGLNGVHAALDPSGRFLLVANHDSGSLSVLPVARDGSLGKLVQIFDLPGEDGPRREQIGTQPHQVVFDPSGRFALVPAKGGDRVLVLAFDPDAHHPLQLRGTGHVGMRPGAGPRHLVFHPGLPVLFVCNEIDSSVALCDWDGSSGTITLVDLAAALPRNASLYNTASAILVSPDGRHVYVSNRGHESIVQLAFDGDAMRLEPVGWTDANGSCPRFMRWNATGDGILVASEGEDRISGFDRDPASGRLTLAGTLVQCPSPSAIVLV